LRKRHRDLAIRQTEHTSLGSNRASRSRRRESRGCALLLLDRPCSPPTTTEVSPYQSPIGIRKRGGLAVCPATRVRGKCVSLRSAAGRRNRRSLAGREERSRSPCRS